MSHTQELEFVLGKIRSRSTHWNHHILSMSNRIVLLKHVLQAILIYFLLEFQPIWLSSLGNTMHGVSLGFSSTKQAKQFLVAWATLSIEYILGGLNLQSFKYQLRQLKLYHIYSLLSKHPTEWVSMANAIIAKVLCHVLSVS